MKNLMLLFIYIFVSYSVIGQIIPNGSFEEWEIVNGYEKPVGWLTNQDPIHEGLVKSNLSHDGNYSLLLFPSEETMSSGWTTCESLIYTSIKLTDLIGLNKSFFFYLKSIPDSTGLSIWNDNVTPYISLRVRMFLNGSYLGENTLSHFGIVPKFDLMEMPITITNADSIQIFLSGGSTANGFDGCAYHSYSWIDDFRIGDSGIISTNKNINQDSYEIFPTPSEGLINIKGDLTKLEGYEIFNLLGQRLENGIIKTSQINIKSKGTLFLVLKSNSGDSSIFKIINQ
ncbi:MAG: hypothetical protein AB8F94_15485 [Saprospiraceae bacterium]